MFYAYVLHYSDGKLYTGFTPDLRKRLDKHKRGFVKATKNRRPLKPIYYEAFLRKKDAQKREKYFKTSKDKSNLKQRKANI